MPDRGASPRCGVIEGSMGRSLRFRTRWQKLGGSLAFLYCKEVEKRTVVREKKENNDIVYNI